jgi:endonuclease YncB( thermonuclease family)
MTRFLSLRLMLPAAILCGVLTLSSPAPVAAAAALAASASASDTESAAFGICKSGGGTNCVVDGDTIWYRGSKIRIADIDTPETHQPRCAAEAARGAAATRRLHQLVNAGPFTLQSISRDEDRYGRKLRILTRGGQSLGDVLVEEGLARYYEGGRRSWC